jgi:hypothetical protein
MTNKAKILRDLAISQSTADSIAPRVDMHVEGVKAVLAHLISQNQVECFPLGTNNLYVYRLKSGDTGLRKAP